MTADDPETPVRVAAASYGQERVWLAGQLSREVPTYHIADRFVLHAAMTRARFRAAFALLTQRHAALRTSFTVLDGVLHQQVAAAVELPVRFVDLGPASGPGAAGQDDEWLEQRCDELADELMYEVFDLVRAPLWRAAVLRFGDGDWMVLFVAHHTVCDPASLFNLHAELTEICVAMEHDREPVLPALPFTYADFAERQRAQLAAGGGRLAAYWRRQLAGLPAVHGIPTDRPRPAARTFAGAEVRTALPAPALAGLPRAAYRHGTSPFVVLLSAYAALAHRRSGRADIAVGVPVTGRDRAELLPLVGTFVNMVVLRADASGDPTFAEFVDRVQQVWLAARANQELPFQSAVQLVAAPRGAGVPPLYQLGFNLLADRDFAAPSVTAEDDLLLEVAGGWARLEYDTALFDPQTARGLLEDYVAILAAGVAAPGTRLAQLPVTASVPAPAGITSVARRFVAPRTASEALVAEIWAQVLGVERVGVEDGFFEIGGHSLQALRILARLAQARGVQVSVQAFFADTTVTGLAAELDRLDRMGIGSVTCTT